MMNLFKDANYYLSLVNDWTDPRPCPVIDMHQGVIVVRDDLLEAGSKSRFIDPMIRQRSDVTEWVYGNSPRFGYGQISLAYVTREYHKKCTLFLAKAKEHHAYTQRAIAYGASVIDVEMGFMTVCAARAAEYAAKEPTRALVPFGLADDVVFGAIIKIARALPITPDEVWTAAGSGVLSRGLQLAWPDANVFAVSVGHKLSYDEIGRAKVIRHELPFSKKAKDHERPPFPSVPEYDAKVWKYVTAVVDRSKTTLFWNVGA